MKGATIVKKLNKITKQISTLSREIICDKGKSFINVDLENWINSNAITLIPTASYNNPAANRLVESFNKTFKGILKLILMKYPKAHWYLKCLESTAIYNTRLHYGLGMSPYFAVHGKDSVN